MLVKTSSKSESSKDNSNLDSYIKNEYEFIHRAEDKLFKSLADFDINELLKRFGINKTVKKQLKSEFIYGGIERRLDCLTLTKENNILDIEFQSTDINDDDLERFLEYILLCRIKYKKPVELFVITLPKISKNKSLYIQITPNNSIEIKVCSLNDDGEIIGKKLKNKINKGVKLTKKDVLDFILYPLMINSREIEELLLENIHLLAKINVNQKEKKIIETAIVLEINKYVVNDEVKKFLWSEINMKIDLLYEMGELMVNENNKKWILNLYNNNFSIEKIVDISGLSYNTVLDIINTN